MALEGQSAILARSANLVGRRAEERRNRNVDPRVSVELVSQVDHGVWIFADSMGNDLGPDPQHVYNVRFEARELWGDGARAGDALYVDLWDDHLEPA